VTDSCDPMDSSLPGSSVHGILQARILEWVAISFSSSLYAQAKLLHGMRDLPRSGIEPVSPVLAGRLVATRPPGRPRTVDFGVLSAFILKGDHVIL